MQEILTPPPLKPGDTIGVMAPSSHVERDYIERSAALLESRGYRVFVHPQTYERDRQSAGTVLQKALAFQGLWQRPDINAIWAAGGGNRCLHLLEAVNFERLKARPKALIGFSDVTALLNAVYAHTGIVTFHGPVFKSLHKSPDVDAALSLLSGNTDSCEMEGALIINEGEAEGPLVGGNLSIFQYLPQTLPGKFWEGGILFLEDCADDLSRFDRMFLHLKRIGVFGEIAGLVLGEFTNLTESGRPYGFTLEDIVREHTEDLKIPVVMNAPFGHGQRNWPLPVGMKTRLDTSILELKFQ